MQKEVKEDIKKIRNRLIDKLQKAKESEKIEIIKELYSKYYQKL